MTSPFECKLSVRIIEFDVYPSSRISLCTVKNVDGGCGRYKCCSPVVTERITDMNFQPREISGQGLQRPASYQSEIEAAEALLRTKETWNGITAEAVARMRLQNRFKTCL